MVEGTDGGREKEVAQPMAGMTYLRNQVYVGRRSIVLVRSRAGLPPFTAAVRRCCRFVDRICRPCYRQIPRRTCTRTRTGPNPNRYLSTDFIRARREFLYEAYTVNQMLFKIRVRLRIDRVVAIEIYVYTYNCHA